jgi:hypothetical protein
LLTRHRDWKKLTFYYFADSYINFNSLVTDLFKIYKTRIWMSAINPASFASPTLGIQAPSGVGIGAVGVRAPAAGERRPSTQHQQQQQQPQPPPQTLPEQQQMAYTPTGMARSFQQSTAPVFTHPFATPERSQPPVHTAAFVPAYQYPQQFSSLNVARPLNMQFVPQTLVGMPTGYDYAAARHFPASPPGTVRAGGLHPEISPVPSQSEWVGRFQGLSLNTR